MKSSSEVSEFMEHLSHPYKREVETLRAMILAADKNISEQIKWNAPSFCINNDDRITFRLQPPRNIQLIFHRGAKVRKDAASFAFNDVSGLVKWITSDRGTVTFKDMNEISLRSKDFTALVKLWMAATMY
jgi:hypothetical protein